MSPGDIATIVAALECYAREMIRDAQLSGPRTAGEAACAAEAAHARRLKHYFDNGVTS